MTADNATLQRDLRALMNFTQTTLPDYGADPKVQCRLGRVLANTLAHVQINFIGDTWY